MTPLQPLRPAGNAQRKALARASEIRRLRTEGYTIEAIREALAAEGLKVSWSTVHREATRPARTEPKSQARSEAKQQEADKPLTNIAQPIALEAAAVIQPSKALEKDTRSPQVIAAEFMRGVNTNPLLQPKREK